MAHGLGSPPLRQTGPDLGSATREQPCPSRHRRPSLRPTPVWGRRKDEPASWAGDLGAQEAATAPRSPRPTRSAHPRGRSGSTTTRGERSPLLNSQKRPARIAKLPDEGSRPPYGGSRTRPQTCHCASGGRKGGLSRSSMTSAGCWHGGGDPRAWTGLPGYTR